MQPLCCNVQEFLEILSDYNRMNDYHFGRCRDEGFMVTTKVRQQFLTSENQGKYIIKGRVEKIKFENLGGGVWRAHF